MFVRIGNTPRDYEWGSTTAIAELFNREPSGAPEAELWLGAHAGSPSAILDPSQVGGARTLAEWIERDPETALGAAPQAEAARLPFLLKILAADASLSLQAHPTPAQAAAGFVRENALGIPLDAANRNYKDAFHKPEMIYALSDTFEALCGFRPVAESVRLVEVLAETAPRRDAGVLAAFRDRLLIDEDEVHVLQGAVGWLLAGGDEARELVDIVTKRIRLVSADTASGFEREVQTVQRLSDSYPGDPGIVLSLLLNRITLKHGEALYLPAGNIHAYQFGLGIELMAASDNVLRGGLTGKHIDVHELLGVLDFVPGMISLFTPEQPERGVEVFRPGVPDFRLVHVEVTPSAAAIEVATTGPAIGLCVDGTVSVAGAASSVELARGESVFVTPDEARLHMAGEGSVFVATTD